MLLIKWHSSQTKPHEAAMNIANAKFPLFLFVRLPLSLTVYKLRFYVHSSFCIRRIGTSNFGEEERSSFLQFEAGNVLKLHVIEFL